MRHVGPLEALSLVEVIELVQWRVTLVRAGLHEVVWFRQHISITNLFCKTPGLVGLCLYLDNSLGVLDEVALALAVLLGAILEHLLLFHLNMCHEGDVASIHFLLVSAGDGLVIISLQWREDRGSVHGRQVHLLLLEERPVHAHHGVCQQVTVVLDSRSLLLWQLQDRQFSLLAILLLQRSKHQRNSSLKLMVVEYVWYHLRIYLQASVLVPTCVAAKLQPVVQCVGAYGLVWVDLLLETPWLLLVHLLLILMVVIHILVVVVDVDLNALFVFIILIVYLLLGHCGLLLDYWQW